MDRNPGSRMSHYARTGNRYGKQNKKNAQLPNEKAQPALSGTGFEPSHSPAFRNGSAFDSNFTNAGHSSNWGLPDPTPQAANQLCSHQPAALVQDFRRDSPIPAQSSTFLSSSQNGFSQQPQRPPSQTRRDWVVEQPHFDSTGHLNPADHVDKPVNEHGHKFLPHTSGRPASRPKSNVDNSAQIYTSGNTPARITAPEGPRPSFGGPRPPSGKPQPPSEGLRTPVEGLRPPSNPGTSADHAGAEPMQTHLRVFLKEAHESRRGFEQAASELLNSYGAILDEHGKNSELCLHILESQKDTEENLREEIVTQRRQTTEDVKGIVEQGLQDWWKSKVLPELEPIKRFTERTEGIVSRIHSATETRHTELKLSIENLETHIREKFDKLKEVFEDTLTTERRRYQQDLEDLRRIMFNMEAQTFMEQRRNHGHFTQPKLPSDFHSGVRAMSARGIPAVVPNEMADPFGAEQSTRGRRNALPTQPQAPTIASRSPEPELSYGENDHSLSEDEEPVAQLRVRKDGSAPLFEPREIECVPETRSSSPSPPPPTPEAPPQPKKRGRPPKDRSAATHFSGNAVLQGRAALENRDEGPSSTRAEPGQAASDAPPKRGRSRPRKVQPTTQHDDISTRQRRAAQEDVGEGSSSTRAVPTSAGRSASRNGRGRSLTTAKDTSHEREREASPVAEPLDEAAAQPAARRAVSRGRQRGASVSNSKRKQRDGDDDTEFLARTKGSEVAKDAWAWEDRRYPMRARKSVKYGL